MEEDIKKLKNKNKKLVRENVSLRKRIKNVASDIVKMIEDLPREKGVMYVDAYIVKLIKEKYSLN